MTKAPSTEWEKLYLPYGGQTQTCTRVSGTPGGSVYYLGHFMAFGPIWPRHRAWLWQKTYQKPPDPTPCFRDQAFQEKCLDKALAQLKDCVVLSTTPTYLSQFQNACLLKARGFELLQNKCYRHPGYPKASGYDPEHPGIPDRHHHWEHIWWKVVGSPKEIGVPAVQNQLNNCGVDSRNGLEQIYEHDKSARRNYLTVAWLPRGTAFPVGWKRFFSAQDYKLGVNFDLIQGSSLVQKCPHDFDLKIFEDWEPDFDKWSPA